MKRAVGLDLGGTFIKAGLVDADGTIVRKDSIPTRASEGSRDVVLAQMARAVEGALAGGKADGIGIGTPGLVDNAGRVYEAPNLPGWEDLPLKDIFEKRFGLPVAVENDVNSIAWGEYLFGAGRGSRTMICVTLGTGLGGGVVVNGRLMRGAVYSAVEIGHITIDYRGPRCNCGAVGCVERFVNRDSIVERAAAAMAAGRRTIIADLAGGDAAAVTPKTVAEAFHRGDAVAAEIWDDVGVCLGAMFAGMVNLVNPDRIVIGGGIAQVGDVLFDAVRRTIAERSMRKLSAEVSVVPAGLGIDAGIVSGAALALRES